MERNYKVNQIKNNKIDITYNKEKYSFDLDKLMTYAFIENDKSRSGKVFKLVAQDIFENGISLVVENQKITRRIKWEL